MVPRREEEASHRTGGRGGEGAGGRFSGDGKWPRYKFYCSFAARNSERVTTAN